MLIWCGVVRLVLVRMQPDTSGQYKSIQHKMRAKASKAISEIIYADSGHQIPYSCMHTGAEIIWRLRFSFVSARFLLRC